MTNDENNNDFSKTYIDDDNSDMATGNKGKFSERIRKIALMKRKNKSNDDINGESDNNSYGSLKRTLLIPLMFLGGMVGKRSETNKKDNIKVSNFGKESKKVDFDKKENGNSNNLIRENKSNLKKIINRRGLFPKNLTNKRKNVNKNVSFNNDNVDVYKNNKDNNTISGIDKETKLLENEILKLIKKKLVKLINEYELLGSDFYVLKELMTDNIYYDKCLQNVKEIKKLLSKINSLKDKYDYLKDNKDFDNLLELEDDLLQDKIIELRNKLESNELGYLVKDYKLFKEYQSLYLKIDKLEEEAIKYEDERVKRCEIFKENKVDFEKFKLSVYNYSSINESYLLFANEQNRLLQELNAKIGNIDSYEKVTYFVKGYGKLLANSFKYMGLLMLSPLKGIIPGIATQTIISKNMIDNLKKNLSVDEQRRTVYEAIDYSDEINKAIYNMDYTAMMIDSSLNDIASLKRKYSDQFKKYQNNYNEYRIAIKQLNKIENAIIGNKIKIDLMKKRMNVNKQVNDEKLVKVRKLNSQ